MISGGRLGGGMRGGGKDHKVNKKCDFSCRACVLFLEQRHAVRVLCGHVRFDLFTMVLFFSVFLFLTRWVMSHTWKSG